MTEPVKTHAAHDGIYPMLPCVVVCRHVVAYTQRHPEDPELTAVMLTGNHRLVLLMAFEAVDRSIRSGEVDLHCLRLQI